MRMCDKNFISNLSNREHECDKSCDIDEYLDYQKCKCRKKLVDNLVEEFSKNIDENEIIFNGTFSDYENVWNSCTICIVFISIAFLMIVAILVLLILILTLKQ